MWRDIDSLRKQNALLKQQNEALRKENEAIESETEQIERETEQIEREIEQIKSETEQLRNETAILKRQNKALALLESSEFDECFREAPLPGKGSSDHFDENINISLLSMKLRDLGCADEDIHFLLSALGIDDSCAEDKGDLIGYTSSPPEQESVPNRSHTQLPPSEGIHEIINNKIDTTCHSEIKNNPLNILLSPSDATKGMHEVTSACSIMKNILVVYCSFHGFSLSLNASSNDDSVVIQHILERLIFDALNKIRHEHKQRGGKLITDFLFYNYLIETRDDLLHRYPVTHDLKNPEYQSLLNSLKKSDRITHDSIRLKYEFSLLPASVDSKTEESGRNKQILLIFDHIEGLPDIESQKLLVLILSRLWNILREGMAFPVKTLIARLPDTIGVKGSQTLHTRTDINSRIFSTISQLSHHESGFFLEGDQTVEELRTKDIHLESFKTALSMLTPPPPRRGQPR